MFGRNAKRLLQEKLINLAKSESAFVGDIISYFGMRDEIEGRVRNRINDLLVNSDEIVLCGHSLGGVILTRLILSGIMCRPATLVTIGTQVGLLAELGFFGWNHPGKIKVENVRWLNIFDASDPLSFPVSRSFAPVEDFRIFTGLPERTAHGHYFHDEDVYRKISSFYKGETFAK